MDQRQYYERMQQLARDTRTRYQIRTDRFGLRELRSIYTAERIALVLWRPKLRKVRAAYFPNNGEPVVLLNASMPKEPKIFSLSHELKHHLADREAWASHNLAYCYEDRGETGIPLIEIGAEIFAAELIFPEVEFLQWLAAEGTPRPCLPPDVVHLKSRCPAKVSYQFLTKRLKRLGYAPAEGYDDVQFVKLERELFGTPFYMQPGFKERRARRRAMSSRSIANR